MWACIDAQAIQGANAVAMNRWMVLTVLVVLFGIWVGVPQLGLLPDTGSVHLFSGLALGAFAFGYIPESDTIETTEPVLLWRRFAAFLIDLIALFMVLHPLMSMLVPVAAVIVGVALVFSYFWLHGVFGRATLGQYVMGYTILPADGANSEPEFAHRTISSFVATCLWPVTFIAASQEDATPGTYHWDRESGTQAVRLMSLKR
ncbi:hypothetical protein GCM10011503_24890 [Henriciella pelagia]|jgi:hypothetical protein|uniref:RDD domain-containing protein n=2 Tax=Henriciella pelagia TaxID=1977912 RepID=A0ABQ1JQS7_9PROT|nr:hypothetical protein GCM10011503_24890 [Henriciella pelagia]